MPSIMKHSQVNREKIVLTGNARAIQDGNTVVGQTLTLYMDDKAVDASGRAKVVISNQ